MNKKRIIAGAIIMSLNSCTHYIDIYRTAWQDKAVLVDGNPVEWTIPLQFYDDKSQLQYTVSNDKDNLYVCIRATNEQTQTKMFRGGMNIWIDTTGKDEQHQVGISFPFANNSIRKTNPGSTEIRNTEKPVDNFLKNRYISGYKEMELIGFKPPVSGMMPLQNEYGIAVSIDWDSSQIMTYEAIIPFRTFYKNDLSDSDSTKRLGISIVLHGLPMPESSGGGHGGGMRGGGGGMSGAGGMNGGGMRGGGGGHGGAGQNAGASQGSPYLYDTNSIKMLFQLSTKKRT